MRHVVREIEKEAPERRLQVNHSPSFTVDTPLDLGIKEELISDTIELVGVDPKLIKKQLSDHREGARNRLYNNAKVEVKLPPVRPPACLPGFPLKGTV